MNIKWYLSDSFACGHVRGEVVAREINKDAGTSRMDCKNSVLISDYPGTHVMVFQRQHSEAILEKMRLAKRQGILTVYEIDDDLFNTPKDFIEPYKFYANPEVSGNITKFINEVDIVTASTQYLAEHMHKRAPNTPIFVVENYLDVDMWMRAYAEKQTIDTDKITIGWMASGSHAIDAPLVMDALLKIMKEYDHVNLHLIGWVGWKQLGKEFKPFKDRIVTEKWIDVNILPQYMKDFDIGLAPLVDNEFNRSKSAIKAYQYWALSVPAVCSDLHPYRGIIENDVNGFLVKSKDGWYDSLKSLIDNDKKRRLMGAHGRKKLLMEYDIKNNTGRWISTFLKAINM